MTIETLNDRIQKAEEAISKKTATIDRKNKTIQKKLESLRKLGIEYTGERITCDVYESLGYSKEVAWDAYWLTCDIDNLKEDIRRAEKEIREKEEKLDQYQVELVKAQRKQDMIENEIPQAFKDARVELVERWTQYDLKLKAQMLEDKKNMDRKEFFKKYTYSAYEATCRPEEELRKANEKAATVWLLDLYNRVKAITGEITDARNIRWAGKALNGYVIGKDGVAEVFTIGAGGYNIQRYHLRVLVKERK